MSATDELRRLLDERGVEHFDGTETTLWGYEPTSESTGVYRFAADETSGGRMQVRMFNLTPEQAVEATLGSGTCHVERMPKDQNLRCRSWLACSECGWELPTLMPANYCPNCGRKLVDA